MPGATSSGSNRSDSAAKSGVDIRGDRYALGTGHFRWPEAPGAGADVDHCEAEALDALVSEHGVRPATRPGDRVVAEDDA